VFDDAAYSAELKSIVDHIGAKGATGDLLAVRASRKALQRPRTLLVCVRKSRTKITRPERRFN
jgi:hypothetical protein